MAAPTIVLQEVSTSDQERGYRVLLARGADIFGEWEEHVAETFVPEDESLDDAVQELREQLEGGAEAEEGSDEGLLDPDDVDDLRRAFEEHDTLKEAAERFELGYGAVRRRMIDAGVYEPRTYDTGGDEPDDDDEREDDEELVYFTSSASGRIGAIHCSRDCRVLTRSNVLEVREKPRSVLEPHKEKCSVCWPDGELPDGNDVAEEPQEPRDAQEVKKPRESSEPTSPLADDDSPHKYTTGKQAIARDYSKLPEANGTLRGLDVKVPDSVTADAVRSAVWSGECLTILDVCEHVGLEVDGAGHGIGAMRSILHRLDLYEDLLDPEGYELPKGVEA